MKNFGEALRFVVVGIAATVVHYTIYILLSFSINVNIAYLIGYLVSFICNFILSNYFTFRTTPTLKRGFGFTFSHAINCLLHLVFLNLFLALGLSKALAPIPVFLIVTPVNFLLVRFFLKYKR